MSVCLLVNDDLQKTFKRYHSVKERKRVEPFIPGESVKNTVLTPTHVYTKSNLPPIEKIASKP